MPKGSARLFKKPRVFKEDSKYTKYSSDTKPRMSRSKRSKTEATLTMAKYKSEDHRKQNQDVANVYSKLNLSCDDMDQIPQLHKLAPLQECSGDNDVSICDLLQKKPKP